jgi:hypothetical protein
LPALVDTIAALTDDFDNSGLTNATIASHLRTLAVIAFYDEDYPTSCFSCGGFTYCTAFGS